MSNWLREETFQQLEVPTLSIHFDAEKLDQNWINKPLPYALFLDLYEVFFSYGAQLIHRIHNEGELELLIHMEDMDLADFVQSEWRVEIAVNANVKIDHYIVSAE